MRISQRVAALAVGAVTASALMAAPAHADTSCAAGQICFWTDVNYTGTKWVWDPRAITFDVWRGLPDSVNNKVTSMKNRLLSPLAIDVYDGNGSGTKKCIGYGASRDVNNFAGLNFDNLASSFVIRRNACG